MDMLLISQAMTEMIIWTMLFFIATGAPLLIFRDKLSQKLKMSSIIIYSLIALYIIFYIGCSIAGRNRVKALLNESGINIDKEPVNKESENPQNGALLYEAAYKVIKSSEACDKLDRIASASNIPELKTEDLNTVRTLLKSEDFAIISKLADCALKKPFVLYTRQYYGTRTSLLPELSGQRQLFRLFTTKASLDAMDGKRKEAYQIIENNFKMLKQFENDPFLIQMLVDFACYNVNISALDSIVGQYGIDSSDAQRFIALMDDIDLQGSMVKSMNGEMAVFLNDALSRVRRGDLSLIHPCENEKKWLDFMKYSPFFYQDYAYSIRTINKLIRLWKEPYWSGKPKLDKLHAELMGRFLFPISRSIWTGTLRAREKMAVFETEIRTAKIILALHIYKNSHGEFPDKLDVLSPGILHEVPRDPYNNKPFEYRKEGSCFKLSSTWLAEKENKKSRQ